MRQQPSGSWSACMSIVLAIVSTASGGLMHEETGSGRVESAADADAAREQALDLARASARRRLAKLFSGGLSSQELAKIEAKATGSGQQYRRPQPYAQQRRGRCGEMVRRNRVSIHKMMLLAPLLGSLDQISQRLPGTDGHSGRVNHGMRSAHGSWDAQNPGSSSVSDVRFPVACSMRPQ